MPDIQSIPLAACKLAPENARHASRGPVDGLAASIAAEGLIDPLHAYRVGKRVMVWDGGRRLRALETLARSHRLPAALREGVPVLISERQAARRRSLVTFVREGLHPVEEFRAYRALFDQGQDPDGIAAAMGVDAKRVAKLLKLCGLAPEILDAFAAGDFGLDTAQAFTLTDDHDRQREVLAACGDWINAGRVRQLLRTGMTSPRERLARFVGRDAYLAAGGGVQVDLFAGEDEDETWTDSGLVGRLAIEKLEAVVEQVKAEGWAWVRIVDPYDHSFSHGYRRLTGEPIPLNDEDQASYDEAVAILEAEGSDPDAYEAAEALIADLDAKQDGGELTAEQRAGAGVFVQVDGGGQLTIRRGFVKDARAGGSALAKTAAASDPALYGWGHTGHWHMTHVATAATRHALLDNPAAAYDTLVAGLAWCLIGGGGAPALRLEPKGVSPSAIPSDVRLAGEAGWEARRQAWRERLPRDGYPACFAFACALTAEDKAEIVALGVGLAMDAVETRFDQHRAGTWDQLGVIARHAEVDITKAWTPDTAFLSRGSKAALLSALAETGDAAAFAKAKKSEMVAAMVGRIAHRPWSPRLLRERVGPVEATA